MTWEERCAIARVRTEALRAMARAGGTPQGWQLRRALEPILGDLLPLGWRDLTAGEADAAERRPPVPAEDRAARECFLDGGCCG